MAHKKIVIIQKDKILKSILELFIEQLDNEVIGSFFNFKESMDFIKDNKIDTLIIDLNSFDNKVSLKNDIALIEALNFPILFIGNPNDIDIAKQMINYNIYTFMSKPVTKSILNINIDIASIKHKRLLKFKQNNTNETYTHSCTVNAEGLILKYNSVFLNLFKLTEEDVDDQTIGNVLINNSELFNFKRFSKKIEINSSKKTVFIHDNNIFQALVKRSSETDFELSFTKGHVEKEILFDNQSLNAKFNSILEQSTESILIFDNNNILIDYNNVAVKRYKKAINEDLYTGLNVFEVLKFIAKHELVNILESIRIPSTHRLERTLRSKKNITNVKIQISPIKCFDNESIGGYVVSSIDITRIIELEKKIKVLKEELKPIYESSIQRFYLINADKQIVAFNEAAQKTIQEEHNHTLQKGDSILQFVPNEIGEYEFEKSFEAVLRGEYISFKNKIENKNKTQWTEVHYEPVINENGELNRVLIWTLDITESERNLIALEESNKRYELVAKGGNDGIWDWDIENNTVHLSARWKNLLGYNDKEIENKFGIRNSLIHPDDLEKSNKKLKACFENGEDSFVNEIRMLCKNQEYKWILEKGVIIRNSDGKEIRMAGSISDITKSKQNEAKLLDLNKSLLEERAMFINGNVGIIRVNANDITNVSYVSENTIHIIGYSPEDFYNKRVPFRDIIHPDDRARHIDERRNAIKNNLNSISFTDYRLIKKDGNIIWVRDFTTIIRNEKGEATDLLGYIIDVSEQKFVEKEHEEFQNMFSALWQSINTETYVVNKTGKILFSNNTSKFSIKKLLKKDYFIHKTYSSLKDWKLIINTVFDNLESYTGFDNENKIIVSKIDKDKVLISTDIILNKN